MTHKHSVYDTDSHFSINPITRAIKNESSKKTTLMQYDHNSERFTFEIPRLVEGHDMSLCNKIEVHYINISSANKDETSADVYLIDDMQISPEAVEEDVVIFSWLISGNATKYAGSLNFLICFKCLEGSTITYLWNTAICKDIFIGNGMSNSESVLEEYSDVLEAWKAEVMAGLVLNIQNGTGKNSVQQTNGNASGLNSASFGSGTRSEGNQSFTTGAGNLASGDQAVANGQRTKATAPNSKADGMDTEASGKCSSAKGQYSRATEYCADAGGIETAARGSGSHSRGKYGCASGQASSVEGRGDVAIPETLDLTDNQAIIDFWRNTAKILLAKGLAAHAGGISTLALGDASCSEGINTIAEGEASHSGGIGTRATAKAQRVDGMYNAEDPTALLIVGNGTSDTERSNAFVVHDDGRATVKKAPTANMDVVNKLYADNQANTVLSQAKAYADSKNSTTARTTFQPEDYSGDGYIAIYGTCCDILKVTIFQLRWNEPNIHESRIYCTDWTHMAHTVYVDSGSLYPTHTVKEYDGMQTCRWYIPCSWDYAQETQPPEVTVSADVTMEFVTELPEGCGKANVINLSLSSRNSLIGTDVAGDRTLYGVSQKASSNCVVQRDGAQIVVPKTPTADTHAASKSYVDSKAANPYDAMFSITETGGYIKLSTQCKSFMVLIDFYAEGEQHLSNFRVYCNDWTHFTHNVYVDCASLYGGFFPTHASGGVGNTCNWYIPIPSEVETYTPMDYCRVYVKGINTKLTDVTCEFVTDVSYADEVTPIRLDTLESRLAALEARIAKLGG